MSFRPALFLILCTGFVMVGCRSTVPVEIERIVPPPPDTSYTALPSAAAHAAVRTDTDSTSYSVVLRDGLHERRRTDAITC